MSIKASRPKLQKMIEDEAEDGEAVAELLALGDMIDMDLEKYDKLRKGDFEGASHVTIKPMYVPYLWKLLTIGRLRRRGLQMADRLVLLISMET